MPQDDWAVVEEALDPLGFWPEREPFVALARLREREAQCVFPSCVDGDKPEFCGRCGDAVRAEAAEARVAELELGAGLMDDRIGRLEEALREIAEACETWHARTWAGIARRALAHEEET